MVGMVGNKKGDAVVFQCSNRNGATLAGVTFKHKDFIKVYSARDWDADEGMCSGGSWGWGGFTARFLKSIADEIVDEQTGVTIWKR